MAYNPKDFGYKDSLPSGNPEKVVKGADLDNEFQAIKRELDALDDELHPGGGDGDLVHEPPNTGKNYVRQGGTATWKEIGTEFINDTNFVSEEGIKDLGADSRRWNKLWVNEVDASGDVNIGGDINVDGNASIDGGLEIHGNIIIDGGQIVDPDGNPAGGVGAGNNIGDVPKWNGSEWVPTFYKTNDLNDVQSATASKDQFLIHNGSQWIAEDFHVDTTLSFQGAVDLTGTAPVNPSNGDLYINDTDGIVDASWGPIAGKTVLAGNAVGFSSAKGRWYLLGDISSAAVTQVREGDCIVVDASEPSRPVVGLTSETQADIDLGVEAHSWGNHAGDISNLQGQINQEVQDREDGDTNLQGQIDDLKTLEGNDISGLQNQITQEIQDRKDGDAALQGQIDQNKSDISGNTNAINDLKNEFDNHDHKLDDLSDVNAGSPTRDDLIIWNGTNWVADDFSFIQTALRFKGGIAPTAAAPTNPEGGDLYVFDSNGTISASWGAIAGREVQAGKFVGYAAGTHNRWFLLGDMADVGVMKVSPGIGVDVDDSKPSEPVVSVEFGTTSDTVARGNHTHSQYLEVGDEVWVASEPDEFGQRRARIADQVNDPNDPYDFRIQYSADPENDTKSRAKIYSEGIAVKTIGAEEIEVTGSVTSAEVKAAAVEAVASVAIEQVVLGGVVVGDAGVATSYTEEQKAEARAIQSAFQVIQPDSLGNKVTVDIDKDGNITSEGVVQAKDYLDADGNSIIGAGGDVDLTNYYTKTESDGKYEPKFAKASAFNKDFGTTSTTVSRGDHAHSQYLTSSNLTGYATEAWVTSGFQPKGNYALVGDSFTKAESDARYELKGEGGGGGGLPDGDWICEGSIYAKGNITAYWTSDERLKDDITAMPVGLIDGINPVTWKWKEGGKKSGGVVAQQLQQCGLGNWVHEAPDGTLGVDYNALIGVLLSEVKSLKDRVRELEK